MYTSTLVQREFAVKWHNNLNDPRWSSVTGHCDTLVTGQSDEWLDISVLPRAVLKRIVVPKEIEEE